VSEQDEAGATPPGGGFPGVDGPAQSTGDTAVNRLAAAVRRINGLTVGRPLDDADLASAADELGALADRLEAAAADGKRVRGQPMAGDHPQDCFPTSPMVGFENPIAPPTEVWAVLGEGGQREIRGRVTFGYQYEGPPTCVHGGAIAELFDELLGLANIVANQAGMTGTLTIRYRRPTPLLAPLDLLARTTGRERRKIFTWGGIYAEGVLTAEAEGIFIEVNPGRMLDIVTSNSHNSDTQLIDPAWRDMIERAAGRPH